MLLFESWWYIRNKIRHLKMKCFYKGGIVTNLWLVKFRVVQLNIVCKKAAHVR